MQIIANHPAALADGTRLATDKGFRPFIGVSVGCKPLPVDIAVKTLQLSLATDAEIVPVMIADDLADINYQVLSDYSAPAALRRARRDGDKHLASWQEAVKRLPSADAERVRFVRWPEVLTGDYQRQVEVVQEEFNAEGQLRSFVLGMVKSHTESLNRNIDDERCLKLCEFIIEEIPSLLFGIVLNGVQYQLSLYPTRTIPPIHLLLDQLRYADFYEDLRNQLFGVSHLEFNTLVVLLLDDAELENSALLNA